MVHAKFMRKEAEPLWYDLPEVLPAFYLMDPQPANDQQALPVKERRYTVKCVMRCVHGFKNYQASYARYEET